MSLQSWCLQVRTKSICFVSNRWEVGLKLKRLKNCRRNGQRPLAAEYPKKAEKAWIGSISNFLPAWPFDLLPTRDPSPSGLGFRRESSPPCSFYVVSALLFWYLPGPPNLTFPMSSLKNVQGTCNFGRKRRSRASALQIQSESGYASSVQVPWTWEKE